jgi:hypothetical protein
VKEKNISFTALSSTICASLPSWMVSRFEESFSTKLNSQGFVPWVVVGFVACFRIRLWKNCKLCLSTVLCILVSFIVVPWCFSN